MVDLTIVWQFLSLFGNVGYWLGATITVLVVYHFLHKKEKKRLAWIVFALLPSIILAYQTTFVLKELFVIPRPCSGMEGCPSDSSLPSGHAGVIFAFVTVVALAVRSKKIVSISIILAILVSLSRVFLNYHTYLDISVGALIGIFIGFIVYRAFKTFHTTLEKIRI